MGYEQAKQAAGKAAADLIPKDAVVGLGTGSTAIHFIKALANRFQKDLSLKAVVASSNQSSQLAQQLGLPIREFDDIPFIDITVDGADEIDPQNRMIKGGGGAHVREKILASSSSSFIVIVDETKLVPHLGTRKLPIEILPFGAIATRTKLEALGYRGSWRADQKGNLFITDNNNLLYDVAFATPIEHPEELHEQLLGIPGVVDTGFFFNMAHKVVIGFQDGTIAIRQ